jgi:hypothetical protein
MVPPPPEPPPDTNFSRHGFSLDIFFHRLAKVSRIH